MKILLIHNYYQYHGGEETYFESLIRLLKNKGHKVITYTKDSRTIKSFGDKIKAAKGLFWNHQVRKELSLIIQKNKPDIAHFHNIYPLIGPTAYFVCKEYKIPIIQHIHNYRFMCPKAFLFRKGKICELCVNCLFTYPSIIYGCYHYSRAASLIFSLASFYHNQQKKLNLVNLINKFIFPAEFTKNYYIKNFNVPTVKTAVIPYFIEGISSKILNIKKSGDYFIFIGRFAEEKGIIELLEIFSQIQSAKLLVIGYGPLQKKIKRYKKFTNIRFHPFSSRKKVFLLMRDAISTIIPSRWYEIGPIVLIESFSVGTPVVVPNHGVFKERVREGKTGFFYESNNFSDLKKIILFVLNKNNFNKEEMKTAILKEYHKYYTQNIHYYKLSKIYSDLTKT